MKTYYTGSGILSLDMTEEQAQACTHPGPCDAEVLRAVLRARLPALIERFKTAMLGVGFVWPEAI